MRCFVLVSGGLSDPGVVSGLNAGALALTCARALRFIVVSRTLWEATLYFLLDQLRGLRRHGGRRKARGKKRRPAELPRGPMTPSRGRAPLAMRPMSDASWHPGRDGMARNVPECLECLENKRSRLARRGAIKNWTKAARRRTLSLGCRSGAYTPLSASLRCAARNRTRLNCCAHHEQRFRLSQSKMRHALQYL